MNIVGIIERFASVPKDRKWESDVWLIAGVGEVKTLAVDGVGQELSAHLFDSTLDIELTDKTGGRD